ncbi:distal tail protein Dit [Cytobacillus sp. FSL W8-0315]|uniref:distal tail protein Dit n=1 Tax=Cytobacillus sp. FSL W8-0315 TaxID=2921600 RepID=UPI0030F8F017
MRNFSFNGITKNYITVLSSNRLPWAPIEREYQEVPNRPGAYTKKKRKTKPRPFPITVLLEADGVNLQKLKEDFASWLIHDEPKPLIPDDEPDRTYYAVVDGSFDPEELVNFGQGVIPFICPDPYKYGEEKTVTLGTGSINNAGTAETTPIINVTFTAAASEYKITHQESGGFVRVIWNFVAGDKLVIDLAKRKIIINDNVNMTAYYWRNRPFMLRPGANNLTVVPASVATTLIKFRPRWK